MIMKPMCQKPDRQGGPVRNQARLMHIGPSLTVGLLTRTSLAILTLAACAYAQPRVIIDHNDNKTANPEFKFARVPSPARNDAAAKATLSLVDAEADGNSTDINALTDGVLPDSEDQPRR